MNEGLLQTNLQISPERPSKVINQQPTDIEALISHAGGKAQDSVPRALRATLRTIFRVRRSC